MGGAGAASAGRRRGSLQPSSLSFFLLSLSSLLPDRAAVGLPQAGEHLAQGADGAVLGEEALHAPGAEVELASRGGVGEGGVLGVADGVDVKMGSIGGVFLLFFGRLARLFPPTPPPPPLLPVQVRVREAVRGGVELRRRGRRAVVEAEGVERGHEVAVDLVAPHLERGRERERGMGSARGGKRETILPTFSSPLLPSGAASSTRESFGSTARLR